VADCADVCPGFDDNQDNDGDGTPNGCDGCPEDPNKIDPGQCGCDFLDIDSDGDGVADCIDGCPDDPDKVKPGICGCNVPEDDTDTDGDGTPDCIDGCPNDPDKVDPGQCGCGIPDDDSDGDGVADCVDICPGHDDNQDDDGDGTPNGCDPCPDDPDKVDPGICGCGVPDVDTDGDGFADCIDNCPDTPNGDQNDCDDDGTGDACEADADDCNANSMPDSCDITDGTSFDTNTNGVPDECEAVCELNKFTASDTQDNDNFSAVAVEAGVAAVGAPHADADSPFVPSAGAVYVYRPSGTTWVEEAILFVSDPGHTDLFGESVSIRTDLVLAGARFDDDLGDNAGADGLSSRSSPLAMAIPMTGLATPSPSITRLR
jgi:hypothetical protein